MMDLQDRCHLANDLGKFHHDLTVLPNPGNHGLYMGNHPQMAELFRLVKYDNLPRNDVLLPSGKRLHSYGKSPFLMGKSTISTGPFSIATLKLPEGNQETWGNRESPNKWMVRSRFK